MPKSKKPAKPIPAVTHVCACGGFLIALPKSYDFICSSCNLVSSGS